MSERPNRLPETASQTAGPYVHIGLAPGAVGIRKVYREDLGRKMRFYGPDGVTEPKGARLRVTGRIFDGDGAVVKDALVEVTQASPDGGVATGFQRIVCDLETGEFVIRTVRPSRLPGPDGRLQAPHLTLWIVARGINIGLATRLYFPDEETANGDDAILGLVPQSRRDTLIARAVGKNAFEHEIHLQGGRETVFFDA
jgi:protocatechuate 3,4-dioxygenase, alpha subunit